MGEGFQFLDIIFFAMVAAFILLRLRSVLGKRAGREKSPREMLSRDSNEDNVVPLPDRSEWGEETSPEAGTEEGEMLMTADLTQVKVADPRFNETDFLAGARVAYEMTVTSFAGGDTDTLRPLVNDEVYKNFANSIQEREQRSETLETTLLAIKTAEIIEANMSGDVAAVTVKFVSEMVNLTRDAEGEIISGDPRDVREVTNIWTFARNTEARNPNWILIATRTPN